MVKSRYGWLVEAIVDKWIMLCGCGDVRLHRKYLDPYQSSQHLLIEEVCILNAQASSTRD